VVAIFSGSDAIIEGGRKVSPINLDRMFYNHCLNEEDAVQMLHQGIMRDSYQGQIQARYVTKIDAQLPPKYGAQIRNDSAASLLWVRLHRELDAICKVFSPPPPAVVQALRRKMQAIRPGVLFSVIDAMESLSESPSALSKALSVLFKCTSRQFDVPPLSLLAPALVTDGEGKPIESLIMRAIELALRSNVGFALMLAEKFPCLYLSPEADGKRAISRVKKWWEVFEEIPLNELEPGCVISENGLHSVQLERHRLVRNARYRFCVESEGGLGTKAVAYRPRTIEIKRLLLDFFQKYKNRRRFLELGFGVILRGNVELLSSSYIFPETRHSLPPDEFTRRWNNLRQIIEPDDMIFVRDTRSFLSTAIAKLDGGAWSHALIYLGEGKVSDIDTDEQGVLALERYNDPKFRIGAYRPYWRNIATPFQGCLSSSLYDYKPTSYAYGSALSCGLKSALMLETAPDTPNGIVYSGIYTPVCLV